MSNMHSPLWHALERLQPVAHHVHRYLLVNQAVFADHMKPIIGLANFEKAPLLRQGEDACHDTATPFLLVLDGVFADKSKARALRQLCDDGCYGNALSVIDSNRSLREMVNALTARCAAQLPENYDVLLRYFDTRIMAALMHALQPAQLEAFFSCAQSWRYSDRSGALVQALNTEVQSSEKFIAPLYFTVEQQNTLIQVGEADAVIDVLMRNKVEPLLDMPYPARHPTVHRYLEAATNWRLSSTSDLTSYCTLALLYGEDFALQPPWDTLLATIKRGELSLREAIVSVENDSCVFVSS